MCLSTEDMVSAARIFDETWSYPETKLMVVGAGSIDNDLGILELDGGLL